MAEAETLDDRARKERSPSFPFIPLQKAVERAKAFADAHRRSPTRLTTLGETWGYGAKSSGLIQTAAALKAFGLAEDIGRGEERRIQLSDLAWRILSDTRPGAKEAALRDAARRPRLLAEYQAHWLPERPTDRHCISELHLDRGFTQEAAKLFLKVFDETASFANLKNDDSLSSVLEEGGVTQAAGSAAGGARTVGVGSSGPRLIGMTDSMGGSQVIARSHGAEPFRLSLAGGRLQGSFDLVRASDADAMIKAIEAWKSLIVEPNITPDTVREEN